MGLSKWTQASSDRIRLDVDIEYHQGEVIKFGLNLSGHIDGEWHDLVRYDSAHSAAHRHIYYPDDETQVRQFVAALPETLVSAAQNDLTENADAYLEEYERRWGNMLRKP